MILGFVPSFTVGNRVTPSLFKQVLAIVLSSITQAGIYYAYDLPGLLNTELHQYLQFENWNLHLAALYSVAILPNIGVGFALPRILQTNHRLAMVIFATVVVIGQISFVAGVKSKLSVLIYVGRFVFGLAAGASAAIQFANLDMQFQPEHFPLVIGFCGFVCKLAAALGTVISARVARNVGVVKALDLSVLVLIVSFGCALALAILQGVEKPLEIDLEQRPLLPTESHRSTAVPIGAKEWLSLFSFLLIGGSVYLFRIFTPGQLGRDLEKWSIIDFASCLVLPLAVLLNGNAASVSDLCASILTILTFHGTFGSKNSPVLSYLILGFCSSVYFAQNYLRLGISTRFGIAIGNAVLTVIPLLYIQSPSVPVERYSMYLSTVGTALWIINLLIPATNQADTVDSDPQDIGDLNSAFSVESHTIDEEQVKQAPVPPRLEVDGQSIAESMFSIRNPRIENQVLGPGKFFMKTSNSSLFNQSAQEEEEDDAQSIE